MYTQFLKDNLIPWWDGGLLIPVFKWSALQMSNYTFNMDFSNTSINFNSSYSNASQLPKILINTFTDIELKAPPPPLDQVATPWFIHDRVNRQWSYFLICAIILFTTFVLHFVLFAKYFKFGRRKKPKYNLDSMDYNKSDQFIQLIKTFKEDCCNCFTRIKSKTKFGENTSQDSTFCQDASSYTSSNSYTSSDLDYKSEHKMSQFIYSLIITLLFIATVISFGYYIVFFTQTTMMFQQQDKVLNSSKSESPSIHSTLNQTIDHLIKFMDAAIKNSNQTILLIVKDASPTIGALFDNFAKELLNNLLGDYKVIPVLESINKFLNTIKTLINSMQFIKDARFTTIQYLLAFKTTVNNYNEGVLQYINSACNDNSLRISAATCFNIKTKLSLYYVPMNSAKINSDSSVTIVTLLDKLFNFNITEIETQVAGIRNLITDNLKLVSTEVNKQLVGLSDSIAKLFNELQHSMSNVKYAMMNISNSPDLATTMNNLDTYISIITMLAVPLYLIQFCLILVLLLLIIYTLYHKFCTQRWIKKHQVNNNNVSYNVANNNTYGLTFFDGLSRQPEIKLDEPDIIKQTVIIKLFRDKLHFHKSRSKLTIRSIGTKQLATVLFCISCICCVISIVGGFAFIYIGSEVENDACRYMTTEKGINITDNLLDNFIMNYGWPLLDKMLVYDLKLPIEIEEDIIPKRILKTLAVDCKNDSVTLFELFNLLYVVNITKLLNSPLISDYLNVGKEMVAGPITEMNATTLIPPEVETILKQLPDLARIVDKEDFTSSITELYQMLLGADETSLIQDLKNLAMHINFVKPNDERAVLIKHFAGNMEKLKTDGLKLALNLKILQDRYIILQENRIVMNLTINLTKALEEFKLVLTEKEKMIKNLNIRYNESVTAIIPKAASLLDPLVIKILKNIGYCDELYKAFQAPITMCNKSLPHLIQVGLLLLISSFLLSSLTLLGMTLLHTIGNEKDSCGKDIATPVSRTLFEDLTRGESYI